MIICAAWACLIPRRRAVSETFEKSIRTARALGLDTTAKAESDMHHRGIFIIPSALAVNPRV